MHHVSRYRAVAPVNIGDTLTFVEDWEFYQEFRACGLGEDDLETIQLAITAVPTGGDVVPVSDNVRDLFYQFSNETTVVIRYVYFAPVSTVLLLAAYLGTEVEPLTPEGAAEAEVYISRQLEVFMNRNVS